MHPILFSIGDFQVHSYGVMMSIAIIVGVSYAMYLGKKRGLDPYSISEVGLWAVVAGLLGARLAYVCQRIDYYLQNPELLLNFRRGGIAVQGGLGAGFPMMAWVCKRHSIKMLDGLDVYIAPVLVGMAIGRIGCVLQGCCYGSPCDASLPWAITYPADLHIACVPRHPSQIYEALMDLVLVGVLAWVFNKAKFYGQTFWTGIAGYGIIRFISEFFRECDSSPVFGISLAQWASLIFVAIGVAGVLGKYSHQLIESPSAAPADKTPGKASKVSK